MTTRFTLNVSKDEMDPQSGHGVQQNATVTSDNPEDLIAALTQLAGVNTATNNYGAQAVVATGACDCDDMESVKEEDYANSPGEQTYDAPGGVGDLVNTDHTARAKNHYTKAGFGDNPLAETDDEEEDDWYDKDGRPDPNGAFDAAGHFYPEREADRHYEESIEQSLSAMLMREWTETKLQAVSEEFDTEAAVQAISEGKTEYVKGSKKFAVRLEESVAKVYPIMENRTLMTMPLFVIDTASLVKEAEVTVTKKSAADSWKQHTNTGSKEHDVPKDPKTGKTLFQKVTSEESVDEASHQADTTMKHVKNPTQGEKDAAKDIKPGIAGYKDRIDMLKSAEKDGRLKEDQESIDAVASSITRRIMMQHTDILSKYGPVKVMAAIDDVAQFAGGDGLDEIGSSDVSIWTKQVIQDLESGHYDRVEEELAEEPVEEGPHAATIGAIAAARYQPKEGDKIRTRKGGQIPGTVEKVGEVDGIEYCWFRHPEGKLYKTPCSNVMREEMETEMAEDNSNIEVSEELADILALAGMHEAKVDEEDVEENAYNQAAAAAARSGAKEFEFPKGSGKMHPTKMDKATAHQMGEAEDAEDDEDKKMDEAKPDFLDLDDDGNKKEKMSDAAKDAEKVDEDADFDYMMSLLNKWR